MKINRYCVLVAALFFWTCLSTAHAAAVTYEFSGGRFGDCLLAYLHAKWFAFKHGIPLVYKPFHYSEYLVMHTAEMRYDPVHWNRKVYDLRKGFQSRDLNSNMLISCPYFPEVEWELERENFYHFFVNWGNTGFRKIVRQMIYPNAELELVYPPNHTVNIAIHVREGGGYDDVDSSLKIPLKVPPFSYYIETILKVASLFKEQPIYCYVFTDALNPKAIVDRFASQIPSDTSIAFDYRREGNRHDLNVLEDFFSFFNFDIMIRPESNYSIVPSLIHDYAIVCRPLSFSIANRVVKIENIDMKINNVLYQKLLQK